MISLPAREAVQGVSGCYAAVRGSDEFVRLSNQRFREAFARTEDQRQWGRAEAQAALTAVLTDLDAEARSDGAVAALVWLGTEAIVGVSGSGVVYEVSSQEARLASDSGTAVLSLNASSTVVLTAGKSTGVLTSPEVGEAVRGNVWAADCAAWLATLTSSRSNDAVTVSVIRFTTKGAANTPWREPPVSPGSQVRTLLVAGAIALAVLFSVVVVVLAAPHMFPKSHAATPSVVTGLVVKSVSPSGASLTWTPIAGATGYDVDLGGRHFRTRGPSLTLTGTLQPGHTYAWMVRALGAGAGPAESGVKNLTTPQLYAGLVVNGNRPTGTVRVAHGQAVSFCWQMVSGADRYELQVTGPQTALLQRIKAGSHAQSSAVCYAQRLATGKSYSWRVGTVAQLHLEGWSKWVRFHLVAAHPAATGKHKKHHPRKTHPTARPTSAPARVYATAAPVYPTPIPTAVYFAPTATAVYIPPTAAPVYVAPTAAPVYVAPAPTAAPVYVPPAPAATAAPTSAVIQCSNPPNCG